VSELRVGPDVELHLGPQHFLELALVLRGELGDVGRLVGEGDLQIGLARGLVEAAGLLLVLLPLLGAHSIAGLPQ
jgi:hypothetical protein